MKGYVDEHSETITLIGDSDMLDTNHACQNCDWTGEASTLNIIKDVFQRVAPGEFMPSGECPKCGALCHEIKISAKADDDTDEIIRKLAITEWASDEINIDASAKVSRNDDGGAWVQAWLYVEVEECSKCKCVEGSKAWGTVGDGADGKCPSCADKMEHEIS
jgi:hypothetical protein